MLIRIAQLMSVSGGAGPTEFFSGEMTNNDERTCVGMYGGRCDIHVCAEASSSPLSDQKWASLRADIGASLHDSAEVIGHAGAIHVVAMTSHGGLLPNHVISVALKKRRKRTEYIIASFMGVIHSTAAAAVCLLLLLSWQFWLFWSGCWLLFCCCCCCCCCWHGRGGTMTLIKSWWSLVPRERVWTRALYSCSEKARAATKVKYVVLALAVPELEKGFIEVEQVPWHKDLKAVRVQAFETSLVQGVMDETFRVMKAKLERSRRRTRAPGEQPWCSAAPEHTVIFR